MSINCNVFVTKLNKNCGNQQASAKKTANACKKCRKQPVIKNSGCDVHVQHRTAPSVCLTADTLPGYHRRHGFSQKRKLPQNEKAKKSMTDFLRLLPFYIVSLIRFVNVPDFPPFAAAPVSCILRSPVLVVCLPFLSSPDSTAGTAAGQSGNPDFLHQHIISVMLLPCLSFPMELQHQYGRSDHKPLPDGRSVFSDPACE